MNPLLNQPAQNLLPLPARRALARTLIWFALPAFALGRDIILDQPTNITVEVGQTATFTVVAKQMLVGAGWGASYTKPKFEWFKGNAKLTNLPTSNS